MSTIKYIISIAFASIFMMQSVLAQDSTKASFAYDLDFQMQFDNREFYRSTFTQSMTIFAGRLTPYIGVAVNQNKDTRHRVLAGIDVMKDFGKSPVSPERAPAGSSEMDPKQSNLDLFREITLFYTLDKKIGKTDLSLAAGIFPRRLSEGYYSRAFFSDSLRFYDNNLEGLLVKVRRPNAYYEVGCDWMGKFGVYSRERFMIFSAGEAKLIPLLSLGYSAYLYHYSCSVTADGVVDNVLINPYLMLDLAEITKMQLFSVRLGWLQSMQNDRALVGKYVYPSGAELDVDVRKWNVGIRNEFFYGRNMMPYYNTLDPGGYKYGNLLYMGSPFYQVHDSAESTARKSRTSLWPGICDRLEVYYAPQLGLPYLDFRISAVFHFNEGIYSGCRQMVSLNFNLQELLKRYKR